MTQEIKPDHIEFKPRPFARYFLIDKVAVGGMAEVFKAIFLGVHQFEMQLILKRILPHLSKDEKFVEMFINEAKIYVELRHHNIVQIYDFSQFQQQYFIALEHVSGKDVKQLLMRLTENQKQIPMEIAVYIGHEICKGLDYAHNKKDRDGKPLGIVHRDLTPANILLSYSGEVKIADFGIAKARFNTIDSKTGKLKGKYEYMSPEQARGEDVDARSDVFAVGILLYEMLTGCRLFKTGSDIDTLKKVKAVDIQEPIQINNRISPRLNQIVMRCLHPSKVARFQEASSLQQALLDFLLPTSLSATEKRLSVLLSKQFSNDRKTEHQRENTNKEKVLQLKAEFDAIPENEIDIFEDVFDDSSSRDLIINEKSTSQFWIVTSTIVSLICIILFLLLQQSNTSQTQLFVNVVPTRVNGTLYVGNNQIGTGSSFKVDNLRPQKQVPILYKRKDQTIWKESVDILENEATRIFIYLPEGTK
jgi:eukaryotic-like serine/threonine-protein kinase